MSEWNPVLEAEEGGRYRAIVDALARDIRAGALGSGTRLPPQRVLATRLGVSIGTVTRAYEEAGRLGLVSGQTGRGTFVSGGTRGVARPAEGDGIVDLSLNIAPPTGEEDAVAAALRDLAADGSLCSVLGYGPHGGRPEHRDALAGWLSSHGVAAGADTVVVTQGAQHGVLLALSLVARPGDVVLTEALTYSGMAALASFAGYRLHGVATDRDGIVPDALDEAFAATGAPALYAMPTFQTPTNATMPAARRDAVASVVARHGAAIVEDDVYGFLHPRPDATLGSRLPDRSFLVASLAKCLAPGLRAGALVLPPAFRDRAVQALRATSWMAAPIPAEIVARLIASGELDRQVEAKRREAARRDAVATRVLPGLPARDGPPSFHVWLPLPPDRDLSAVAVRAGLRGVRIGLPTVAPPGPAPSGLRLCLGGAAGEADLERALAIVASVCGGDAMATV